MERGGAPYLSIDPATGQLLATYPDGSVVPVDPALAPQITNDGGPDDGQGTQGTSGSVVTDPLWFAPTTDGADRDSGTDWSGSRGGYSRGAYGSRGSSGGYTDYDDARTGPPTYGDRSTHPFFGGQFRTPGGFFNDGGGDEYRAPLSAPPTPRASYDGGGSGGGGGGGGDTRGLIAAWRAKLIGNAYPGSGSGSYEDYGTERVREPREEKMRGPYAKGLDPDQALGLGLRPTALLPTVFPDLGPETPAYQTLANLPAAQLAMLSKGYKGTPRSLANSLGRTYERAGAGELPSTQSLMKGLAGNKGLDTLFQGERAGKRDAESYSAPGYVYGKEPLPLGEASSAFGGLLDAALINLPGLTQAKYGSMPGAWGSYLIDRWGSKALRKPAGKGPAVNRFVTRRLFG